MIATEPIDAVETRRLKSLKIVGSLGPPDRYRRLSSRIVYFGSRAMGQWIWLNTFNARIIGKENLHRSGGYQLATSHVSHMEPFLLSIMTRRQIDWATRIEFFQNRFTTWYLSKIGAFSVHRQGTPVSAIRTALKRVQDGRIVGICPEGGVTIGANSVCRGGAIKLGACLIAYRTNTPIVPVVMVGTNQLTRVKPWLPFRRTKLWIAVGDPVFPDTNNPNRKAERVRMAGELQSRYVKLYNDLREKFADEGCIIPDSKEFRP